MSTEHSKRVLGIGQYEARWIQRSTLVELTATGILPCFNYQAQLEKGPEKVLPAVWDMVFYLQDICLKAIRPFSTSVIVHDAASAEKLIVHDAAGRHEVPIQQWIGAEPLVARTEAIEVDLFSVHARLPKIGDRPYGCIIAPYGTLLPAIYYRVFGPAPLLACEEFKAKQCQPAGARLRAKGSDVPWPWISADHAEAK